MKPALPKPLKRFLKTVPSEKACHKYHFQRWISSGQAACDRCRSQNLSYKSGRTAKCGDCKKNIHFYSGTFYERVRRVFALTALVIAAENGYVFNSVSAASMLRISQSCAWELLQRVRILLGDKMPAIVQVSSENFSAAICKRSRNTPAGAHPVVELSRGARHRVQKADAADKAVVTKILSFQKEYFHGISPRYLQLYVAQFWSLLKPPILMDEALQKACWTRADSGTYLRNYDSGALVLLPAA